MRIHFRKRSVPELAGLDAAEARARLREAQQQLGLKPALLSSALFGGATLLGVATGTHFGEPLGGTLIGWLLGMWMYGLVRLNASRPLLREQVRNGDASLP